MKVREAMSRDIYIAHPDETLQQAEQMMDEFDLRILPVVEDGRLIAIFTDRDLALFGLAKGHCPGAKLRQAMRHEHLYCHDDQDVTEVSRGIDNMQVRRVPVVDRDEKVVGILSLSDVTLVTGDKSTEDAMNGVSRPADGQSHPAGTER